MPGKVQTPSRMHITQHLHCLTLLPYIPHATLAATSSLPPMPLSTTQPSVEKEVVEINHLEATPAAPPHPSPTSTPLPSVEREVSTINPLEVDYQSLPSPTEPAYECYEPGFGKRVSLACQASLFGDRIRVHKYGAEIAKQSRYRFTPSPVRRKYEEEQAEVLRVFELGTPGADDSDYTPEPVITPRKQNAMNVPKIADDEFSIVPDEDCIATNGGAKIHNSYVVSGTLQTDHSLVTTIEDTLPSTTSIQTSKKRRRSDVDVQLKDYEDLSEEQRIKRARSNALWQRNNTQCVETGH